MTPVNKDHEETKARVSYACSLLFTEQTVDVLVNLVSCCHMLLLQHAACLLHCLLSLLSDHTVVWLKYLVYCVFVCLYCYGFLSDEQR